MNEVAFGLSISAIVLTLITSVFSIIAYAEVLGMKKSTHKIEWQPIDQEEPLSEFEKEQTKDLHEYLNGDI